MNEDAEPAKYKEMRKRLLTFLKNSSHYDIQKLLICAQDTDLHEERVILNSKHGSHSKALHILIYEYKMPDAHEKAEEYCLKNDEASPSKEPWGGASLAKQYNSLLLELLQLYTYPEQESYRQEFRRIRQKLLQKHFHLVDPCKVLDLFEQSTTIADAWPYLSSVLSQKCAECRNNQVAMNLLKMNNLQVQVSLIEEKAKINFETFLRILIKINVDSDNRPMSCKQFMMELESGEYGNFDFEDEALRYQFVLHGLSYLVNRNVFRRRILKKTEDEEISEYWVPNELTKLPS